MRFRLPVTVLATIVLLAGCGDGDDPSLSPAASEGRDLMRSATCSSCHGNNGQGGVGPAFVGLYQSEVPLDDGTTVIADRDYLRESITEPDAKRREGYRINMPTNNLTDAEVERVVDYIVELGEDQAS